MWYWKWMEEFDRIDTPAVKEWRYKNYWYILELSGAFTNWKPKVYVLNLFYVLMVLINLSSFFVSHVVTVFKVDDIGIAGQALNYAALLAVCVVTIVFVNVERESLVEVFDTCIAGFYDYKDGQALPKNIRKLKNQFEGYKKIVRLGLIMYAAVVGAVVLFADQIDTSFNYEISNATYVNGVYYKLPVKMWTFFTIETDLEWLFMLSYLAVGAAFMAGILTSAILLMIFLGEELILQQSILHNACLNMDKRANALYKKLYGRLPPAHPLKRTKDSGLMKCYEHCLVQVVEHHRVIMRYTEKYTTILNWPGGIVFISGSISIAMSAITFLKGAGKPSSLMSSTTLLAAEILIVFIVCEIGQIIKDLSEDTFDAMYSFQWMDCSKELNKQFAIMKHVLSRPIVLVVGSLKPLDRDTFNTMMSSAYSYMNLLRVKNVDE